mmetsp:Transcript_19055/g.53104  ORF Transcript_19055/g.53104 Transcript_19055/m.53104 type:complete len:134 (-) Transcript_19055:1192-1593(-)
MSHFAGIQFPSNRVFDPDDLVEVHPINIYRWMCWKVYGKVDPSQEDNPLYGRALSMMYWKKAISYFMPNNAAWNDSTETGNPTRSKMINNLIWAARRKETRLLGKDTQADRSFTNEEFRQVTGLLNGMSIQSL